MTHNTAFRLAIVESLRDNQPCYVVDMYGIADIDCKFRPLSQDSPYDVVKQMEFGRVLGDMSQDSLDARIKAVVG